MARRQPERKESLPERKTWPLGRGRPKPRSLKDYQPVQYELDDLPAPQVSPRSPQHPDPFDALRHTPKSGLASARSMMAPDDAPIIYALTDVALPKPSSAEQFIKQHGNLLFNLTGCLILLAIVIAIVNVVNPRPLSAPVVFSRRHSPDNSLFCDAPRGWDISAIKTETVVYDDPFVSGVEMKSGGARIAASAYRMSSYVTDALAGPEDAASVLRTSKLDMLNFRIRKIQKKSYSGYHEILFKAIQTQMGEGRVVEWIGQDNSSWPSYPVHGYRACLIGGAETAAILCTCRDHDWKTLRPAFTRVINSTAERADGTSGSSTGFVPLAIAQPSGNALGTPQYQAAPDAPASYPANPYQGGSPYPTASPGPAMAPNSMGAPNPAANGNPAAVSSPGGFPGL